MKIIDNKTSENFSYHIECLLFKIPLKCGVMKNYIKAVRCLLASKSEH